jgi:hypothetical protein
MPLMPETPLLGKTSDIAESNKPIPASGSVRTDQASATIIASVHVIFTAGLEPWSITTMPNNSALQPSAILFSSIRQSGATVPSRYISSVSCPHCGQHKLKRIRRRRVDRLLGSFVTLRRFTCCELGCRWQGNLIKKRTGVRSPLSVSGVNALMFGFALLLIRVFA